MVNRILHVFGELNQGGAETRTMEIYRKLDKNLVQFDFVVHSNKIAAYNQEVIDLGGRIHVIPKFKGYNILNYRKAWTKFFSLNQEYRILHGHMLSTAFIYMKIAKKFRLEKIIAHARSSNSDSIIKLILIRLARFYATDLVAVSRLAADKFFGKIAASKARIFYNSIEIQKYYFNPNYRNELIKEYNLDNHRIIGHIGRFHPAKNHKFLIKIFYKLVLLDPSFTLVLVGTGSEKVKIEKLVSKLGLTHNVIFTGARVDAYKFYSLFDLFLFPSHYEGFPGVILEAQVSGLPILMSKNVTDEVIYNQNVIQLSLKNKRQWIQKIRNDVNFNRQVDVLIVSKIKSIDAVIDEYFQLYSQGR